MEQVRLLKGDNIELLKTLEDNSIDSIVSDPPYGLSAPKNSGKTSKGGFMNKKWDYDVPSVELWKEVLRVLKPGGHVLSFGGTRTYHRMVVNMEDAGFEIRDCISYNYGSGFPKSHNIGKSIKKLNGSDDFDGMGTALKPSMELICLARKPLTEKSIAENVLKHGTGGINIDDCRVGTELISHGTSKADIRGGSLDASISGSRPRLQVEEVITEGRFPANTILECICDEVIPGETIKGNENYKWSNTDADGNLFTQRGKYTPRTETTQIHTNPECPCYILDKQSGTLKSGKFQSHHKRGKTLGEYQGSCYGKYNNQDLMLNPDKTYGDTGGASRFFYTAKVSKKERNMGLDEITNFHPTVKPVNLMTYLCRLITPRNGVILDMYMGSGSTGISALLEGFKFVGMEMDEDYFNIAEARINNYEQYRQFKK